MTSVWGEFRRRNVAKVAVAYAIVSWLLVQIADVAFPALLFPDWVLSAFVVFLTLGFPITVLVAWAFELTPEGIKRTDTVPLSQSITHLTGQKINHIVTGLLVLVVVFLAADNYVLVKVSSEPSEETPPQVLNGPGIPLEEERPDALYNSVAVLPFENLSPDPDNAYFAAGIHEEILNQLSQLQNLNVIARTSVLKYAGGEISIPEIARELNVQTVMEGSVRYAGDSVRVAAQLIDGASNTHLWTDAYSGDLADVFAIQYDIAMNIANALEAEFSQAEQQRIEKIPTESPEAYALYLKVLAGSESWRSDLEQAIALDPRFALAHALKARQYASCGRWLDVPCGLEDWQGIAQAAAERALALDPALGSAHVALGILQESTRELSAAHQSFELAYQLSPTDRTVLEWYARFYRDMGEFDEAIRVGERAVELNPNDWYLHHQLGVTHRFAMNYDAATTAALNSIAVDPTVPNPRVGFAMAQVVLGNTAEAVRQLQIAEQLGANESHFRLAQMALTYAQAGRHEDARRLFDEFVATAKDNIPVADSVWAMVHVAVGDYDQAFRHLETAVNGLAPTDVVRLAEVSSNSWGDPLIRNDPRFQELLSRRVTD